MNIFLAPALVGNFILLIGIILILWMISMRLRDVSFIDAFWAYGMVILAVASALRAGVSNSYGYLILGLVMLWGLRLGTHLLIRWHKHGEDPRYVKIIGGIMEKRGWSWNKTALIIVFLTQTPLLFITCLPAQIGLFASSMHHDINWLAFIGAALALIGILFETIGDFQLVRFRANPNNAGKVLDTGLWRYTRHPNYFGDACTWWGIWLVAADAGMGVAVASMIGPIFLTYTLLKWSGGPLLERGLKKSRPGYADYIARTSGFFPWPPKN